MGEGPTSRRENATSGRHASSAIRATISLRARGSVTQKERPYVSGMTLHGPRRPISPRSSRGKPICPSHVPKNVRGERNFNPIANPNFLSIPARAACAVPFATALLDPGVRSGVCNVDKVANYPPRGFTLSQILVIGANQSASVANPDSGDAQTIIPSLSLL